MGFKKVSMLETRVAHSLGMPLDAHQPALGELARLDRLYHPVRGASAHREVVGRTKFCKEICYDYLLVSADPTTGHVGPTTSPQCESPLPPPSAIPASEERPLTRSVSICL